MNFSLFAVLYIAGMMFYDFTAQSVPVNMCVNFCCSDRFVAQHTLYGAQVGSSFKQVGGKGMAEGVRTDVLVMPAFSASSLMRWNTMMREIFCPSVPGIHSLRSPS